MGEGPLVREGRPDARQDDPGDRVRRARHRSTLPEGVEGNLDAEVTYDPPNLTFPFGAYICVVDVDPGTGQVKVRRFIAVDDCGTRINPMIIEGQIHGGLAEGVGMALMEFIGFDEQGNCLGGSFMDYLIPTSMEVPDWELGHTVTPSPHHPIGAKGVGESPTVGSPPAIVNAIVDALAPFGVTPHGHALHAGPGVGGHAGPGRSRRHDASRPDARPSRGGADAAARRRSCEATVVRGAAADQRARRATPRSCAPTARIDGFVGGACADVDRARCTALRAVETEQPLLLRIRPGRGGGPAPRTAR